MRYCRAIVRSPSIAPVAQLDRVLPSEGRGHRFESCRARHFSLFYSDSYARPSFTASPDFSNCVRFVGLDSGHISDTFLVSLDCRQSFQPCDKIG